MTRLDIMMPGLDGLSVRGTEYKTGRWNSALPCEGGIGEDRHT